MEIRGEGPDDGTLKALLLSAAAAYRRHPSVIAEVLADSLRLAAELPSTGLPATVPACQLLRAVFDSDTASEDPSSPLHHVAQALPSLSWRIPGAGRIPDAIGTRMAAVEIVGPSGMIDYAPCRFGLYLQRSHSRYPEHFHDAEELYFVLSGTAEWYRGTSPPTAWPPGSFIHHRTREIHATHTGQQPLLAGVGLDRQHWLRNLHDSGRGVACVNCMRNVRLQAMWQSYRARPRIALRFIRATLLTRDHRRS
jgi:dimethylpropiothetin dethiomethylase